MRQLFPIRRAVLLGLLAAAGGALADGPVFDPTVFQSFDIGFRCKELVKGTARAPGTVLGTVDMIDPQAGFTWTGTDVPGVLGLSFGVRTMAQPGTSIENVEIIVTHPPMAAAQATRQIWVSTISDLGPGVSTYAFDMPFEVLPGDWSIEARSGTRVLYHVDFKVFDASMLPEWQSPCGTDSFTS